MLKNDLMRVLKIVGLFAIAALTCAAVAFAAPSSFREATRLATGRGGDPANFCTPALTGMCPATDGAPGTTTDTTAGTKRHDQLEVRQAGHRRLRRRQASRQGR